MEEVAAEAVLDNAIRPRPPAFPRRGAIAGEKAWDLGLAAGANINYVDTPTRSTVYNAGDLLGK